MVLLSVSDALRLNTSIGIVWNAPNSLIERVHKYNRIFSDIAPNISDNPFHKPRCFSFVAYDGCSKMQLRTKDT